MLHEQEGIRAQTQAARWAPVLPGVAVFCLGLITTTGWLLRIPSLIQLRPGWGSMVLTTSVCATLAGAALGTAYFGSARAAVQARVLLGSVVFFVAALTAAEIFTGRSLGVDTPALHAAMLPEYPPPGRMAPNTTLSFFLVGLALVLWGHGGKAGAVRTLSGTIFLIGGLGFAGYCLGLKFLYGWYTSSGLTEMSLPTSLCVMMLAIGLWQSSRDRLEAKSEVDPELRVLQAILSDTLVLVTVSAIAVAITGVGVIQSTVFRYTADHLAQLGRDDRELIELTIDHRSERAAIAGSGEWLAQLLRKWDSHPGEHFKTSHAGDLSAETMWSFANTLLGQGFSGVLYRGSHGRTMQVGRIIDTPPARMPIRSVDREELIWSDGFYLATAVEMRDKDGIAGEMLAQQPLPTLDRIEKYTNSSSQTGALVLCGRTAEAGLIQCFPMRSEPLPFRLNLTSRTAVHAPLVTRTQTHGPLPMALALAGKSGTILTRDYRGHPITAAYSPLENGALGLVLKIDTAETYAPVRRGLSIALPVGTLIVLICLRLMQRRLTPLVNGLVSSRAKIRQLALHDPLTGLPNRSLMDDRLRMALEWARRNQHSVALAVVDLDDFKLVNDTLGHEAGDLLLCAVARRLENCLRGSDTVARLGGDEFVLILNEIQSASAVNIMAQKILASFSTPIDLSGEERMIRLSIGFALSPPGGGGEGSLMRNADAAMYSAKRSGGSQVVIYEDAVVETPGAEALAAGSVVRLQPIVPA